MSAIAVATARGMGLVSGLWLVGLACGVFVLVLALPLAAAEHGLIKNHQKHPVKRDPNLKFRRGFLDTVVIGSTGHQALSFEIGNDLMPGKTIGDALEIKAHLTFLDDKRNKLAVVCPGWWHHRYGPDTASIPRGESRPLAVVFQNYEDVFSSYSHDISLRGCKFIELVLLDRDGKRVMEANFEWNQPLGRRISVPSLLITN